MAFEPLSGARLRQGHWPMGPRGHCGTPLRNQAHCPGHQGLCFPQPHKGGHVWGDKGWSTDLHQVSFLVCIFKPEAPTHENLNGPPQPRKVLSPDGPKHGPVT